MSKQQICDLPVEPRPRLLFAYTKFPRFTNLNIKTSRGYVFTTSGLWAAFFWKLLSGFYTIAKYLPTLKIINKIFTQIHSLPSTR